MHFIALKKYMDEMTVETCIRKILVMMKTISCFYLLLGSKHTSKHCNYLKAKSVHGVKHALGVEASQYYLCDAFDRLRELQTKIKFSFSRMLTLGIYKKQTAKKKARI